MSVKTKTKNNNPETKFEYKFEYTSLNSLILFSFACHTFTHCLLTHIGQCEVIFGSC